jgi:LuxR family maltose regulon positive regulatory protein
MDGGRPAPQRQAPPAPRHLIRRQGLLRRLDDITRHAITCITAPRGAGKTTLVAEWCRRAELPLVWIEAASSDDLLANVADLHQLDGRLGGASAAVVLVVDRVDSPELASSTLAVARRVLSEAPEAHVVLVGCCAAPELVALQMDGSAWQLGDELALDAVEVAEVVTAYSGWPVPDDEIGELAEWIDGWMAAAVLTGLSSPRGDRTASGMYAAAADSIDAYVTTALLDDLPADLREFVGATSVIDDLEPPLCDVLTGGGQAEHQLARLRSLGFPIVHGPTGHGRYLRPVRDALGRGARRDDPAAHDERLRTAAGWYAERHRPLDAARGLVRLGDWQAAERAVLHDLPPILDRDEIAGLAELVRQAPPALFREHVSLALAASWVLRMDGRGSAADEMLDIHMPSFSDRGRMIADLSRASAASWAAEVEPLADLAEAALAACDRLGDDAFAADGRGWHGDSSTDEYRARARAAAQLACAYGGMWERGARHLVPMSPVAASQLPTFQLVACHGITATFHALGGAAGDALVEAHRAVTLAAQADLLEHRLSGDASFALGEALRLQLRHAEAGAPLDRAQRLGELNGRENLVATALAARAHLAVDAGRPDDALTLVAEHRRRHPFRHPPTVGGFLAAAEARALNATGRFVEARRAVDTAPRCAAVASMRVAALLGVGDVAEAQATVRAWPDDGTVDSTVRRALAAAVICEHTGDRRGRGLLHTALAAAAPQALGQPFVEHGPSVARLLRRVARDDEFAHALQRWLGEHGAAQPVRFTTREQGVMAHIVAGRKVRETAAAMNISVNTVRSHLRAIHRKLGVDNRADAVRAWLERDPGSAGDE